MDGGPVSDYGVDIGLYFAGDVASYFGARYVVYSGRGIVVFVGGHILSVAAVKVFARGVALVRDWGNRVFLFRGAVRMYSGFLIKNAHRGIFLRVQCSECRVQTLRAAAWQSQPCKKSLVKNRAIR